jgi:hypothetical protein
MAFNFSQWNRLARTLPRVNLSTFATYLAARRLSLYTERFWYVMGLVHRNSKGSIFTKNKVREEKEEGKQGREETLLGRGGGRAAA